MVYQEGQVLEIQNKAIIWFHSRFAWDKQWDNIFKDVLKPWLHKKVIETSNWDDNPFDLVGQTGLFVTEFPVVDPRDGCPVALLYLDTIDRYAILTCNDRLKPPANHVCRRCGRMRDPSPCWLCGHL